MVSLFRRKHCTAILITLVAGLAPSVQAAKSSTGDERYTYLLLGHPSGYEEIRHAADGSLRIHFEYNDRGRGPSTDARYVLAQDRTVLSVDLTGHTYLKAPVDEHFSISKGVARWRSTAGSGEQAVSHPAFYLSMDGSPSEAAFLAQALLKTPDHKLAMLPAGEASLQTVREAQIKGRQGALHVTLYAITGLDFVPAPIWLDDRGHLFASYSEGWSMHIRSGWEDAAPQIEQLQEAEDTRKAEQRARALTHPLTAPLLIEHARVFDPDTKTEKPGQSVLIRGTRIDAVGDDGALTLPADIQRLDAGDRFLMPGLWDMHVHMNQPDGVLDIAAGITTVRDLGNDPDLLAKTIEGIESGRDIGPRIIKAGLIDGHGPYQGPSKVYADTPEEAIAAVDHYAELGFVQIKIYSSVKPELVPVIVREARAKGLRVSGHVPAFMNAEQFIADGVDEIQHINFILLNFFFDQVQDTRTPARFTTLAEHASELDLGSKRVQDFVALMKQHHVVSDPTASVFEGMFLERPGIMGPSYAKVVDRLPLIVQRGIRAGTGGLAVPAGKDALYRESYARMVDMIGLMYRSGVTIVAGTDGNNALMLPREFELYVSAGIPPADVLRLDTLGAAQVMKRDKEYGRIAAGYVADLILVDGDPVLNIADIRKVRTVIRGDRLYDSGEVFKSFGIAPAP